ncbi:hypothetical protein V1281_000049 [Nitrobacteraceae bacterium AZCC 2161]
MIKVGIMPPDDFARYIRPLQDYLASQKEKNGGAYTCVAIFFAIL